MSSTAQLSSRGEKYAAPLIRLGNHPKIQNVYNAETNPSGVINLGSALNALMAGETAEFLDRNRSKWMSAATTGRVGSTFGSQRLRIAMAAHMNRNFCPQTPLDAENLTVACGTTAIAEMLAFTLANEGDGVLLDRPVYSSHEKDLRFRTGLQTVYIDTDGVNNFDLECGGIYETALLKAREDGINVRILLICNPHNPLGRCYPKDTLKAIMNLCAKYSLHLISDEIFALSTFEAHLPSSGVPFTSVLSCPSDLDPSNIHSMYGLSKDFAASGLRIGCVASHNADLHVSLRAVARYSWPSVVSDAMGATILEDTAWVDKFLAGSHEAVAESYLLTVNELQKIGINCAKSSAAVFVWVDFSPLLPLLKSGGENNAEDMFAREMQLGTMFIDNSVFLEPASQYKGSKPGWFRFVHTCERNELLEALRRIAKVCNDIQLGHSGGL